jgi:hypothetical protein
VLGGGRSDGEDEGGLGGACGGDALIAPAPQAAANRATTASRTVMHRNRIGVDGFIHPMVLPHGNLAFTLG